MNTLGNFRSAFVAVLAAVIATTARAGDDGFEKVYDVQPGVRLVVEQVLGSLEIVVWDRDAISVEANFDAEDFALDVRDRGLRFTVDLAGHHGLSGDADLALRVPAWMPIEVSGHQVDVEIEGVESSVQVELVGGDVFVRGGRGEVRVQTVHGSIAIHDAVADFDLSSANEDIELRDCKGEVRVESVNGDVRMEGLESGRVEIETTNGDVLVDGILDPSGDYHVSTHSGDVAVSVAPDADLRITIETYYGKVRSDLDATLEEVLPGKRYRVVVGEGRGSLDIESFQGDVTLYDPKRGRRKHG